MKIHQSEIDAAIVECPRIYPSEMSRALRAALLVRKQRKAAKRERQRKEKDKQVVESVTGIPIERGMNEAERADFERKTVEMMRDLSTPSKAPEWDGAFREGEVYQMRNGHKAYVRAVHLNELIGDVDGIMHGWPRHGKFLNSSAYDLIRPWPKGEQ